MTSLNLLEPVSEENPCGPDLELGEDPDFVDYYFEAEARMPERYFTPGNDQNGMQDQLFDAKKEFDLPREKATIGRLLARSRDLRLTGLLARFQILGGSLGEFTDTIEDMAAMMAQWPEELHPRVKNGAGERKAAIESLNYQPTVVMPLQHLSLIPNEEVTLRRHLVAGGKATPRSSEQDISGSDLLAPLRAEGNRRVVDTANDYLTRIADALHRIVGLASSHPVKPFTVDLGALRGTVSDMQSMILSARPDLRGWSVASAAQPAAPDVLPRDDSGSADPTKQGQGNSPVKTSSGAMPTIANRATALAALDAAKAWIATNEPSSPAFILVTQARLLVGAPLVEAIEVLMPGQSGQVLLNIGQGSSFSLPMARLKELTQAALENHTKGDGQPAVIPAIAHRGDLIGHLLGVEGYFNAQEPASPIPLLLVKAREMLEKRFDAIIAELLVPPVKDG